MKILIASEDKYTIDEITQQLIQQRHTPYVARNGEDCLRLSRSVSPDLMILDISLSGMDHFELCQKVREESDIRIILLASENGVEERIRGLECCADDCITKPYDIRELMARVNVVLHRSLEISHLPNKLLQYGDLIIDPDSHEIVVDGRPVHLTVTEFKLLHTLASNPGKIFSRENLLNRVWSDKPYSDETVKATTLDVHLRRLREKIETDPSLPKYVVTVKGVGVRFGGSPTRTGTE